MPPKLYFSSYTLKFLEHVVKENPAVVIYDAQQKLLAPEGPYVLATALGVMADDGMSLSDTVERDMQNILEHVPPSQPVVEVIATHRGEWGIPDAARKGSIVNAPKLTLGQPKPEFTWGWLGDLKNSSGPGNVYVVVYMKRGEKQVEMCRMESGVTDDATGCVLRAKTIVDALNVFAELDGSTVNSLVGE